MGFASQSLLRQLTRVLASGTYDQKKEALRTHPISPPDGNLVGVALSPTSTDTDWGKIKIQNVSDMVGYIRLLPAASEKTGAITFDFKSDAQRQASRFPDLYEIPCWFLPWKSRRLVKLKITDVAQNNGAVNLGGNNWVDNPPLFLTAALSGCSVFAVGGANDPSVFHGGFNHGNAPPLNPGEKTEEFWRRMLGKAQTNKTIGSVGKTDYVNELRAVPTSNTDRLGTTSAARALQQHLAQRTDVIGLDKATRIEVGPWGCVYGLRNPNGGWMFELVKNATMAYWKVERRFGRGPRFRGETRPALKWLNHNTEEIDQSALWSEQVMMTSVTLGYERFFPGVGHAQLYAANAVQIFTG